MSFEVEIKVRLKDTLNEIKLKLESLGSLWAASVEHADDYYIMPPGFQNFAETDEALRIRTVLNGGQVESADITYKGKKVRGDAKTREEIVVDVSDPVNLGKILEHMGSERQSPSISRRNVRE